MRDQRGLESNGGDNCNPAETVPNARQEVAGLVIRGGERGA